MLAAQIAFPSEHSVSTGSCFRRLLFIFCVCLCLAGAGCNHADKPKSKGVIGVSVLTLSNPFFKVIGDTITAEAAKHGYDVVVVSGDRDVVKQQNQINDFLVQQGRAPSS